MAANINPIFGRTPDVQVGGSVLGPTAVTVNDGSGAYNLIFTADATEGGFVDQIILKPIGTTAATVCRVYFCTATGAFTPGTTNTAANTSLIGEITLLAYSVSNSVANNDISIPIRKALPPGTRLLLAFGTSTGAAGNGFAVTTFGMKY